MTAGSIVIFGLSPQGLFLLREYSKKGINVHAVGRPEDVGIRSRYGKISVLRKDSDFLTIIERILESGFGGSLAYVTSDYFLQLICNGNTAVLDKFEFSMSALDTLQILTDKKATYEYAARLGIRIPATFPLRDYEQVRPEDLPLILKWNETPLGTQVPFKTLVIDEWKSLPAIAKEYESFFNYLILQQIIVGQDLSYAGYFQDKSEQLGCVTEKKRQYPIWGGLGSYVADYVGPSRNECHDAGRRLAESLGVVGFIEVEFKYDMQGALYLIEANPRIWGWAKFLKLKCTNFPEFLLDPNTKPIVNPNHCKWFSLLRDAKSIWSLLSTRKSARVLAEVAESYKGEKIFDILEWRDLRPFFYQFYKGIRRTG